MPGRNLERLGEDLRTIEAAAGLNFPYQPAHIRTAYVFAAAALAAAAFAWLARGLAPGWRVAAELALVLLPVMLYASWKHVPIPGDARQARELSGFTLVYFGVAAGSIALVVWLMRIRALEPAYAPVVIGAIFCAYFIATAAKDKRLRSWYGAGLGAVALPLVYLATALPLDFLVALALGLGVFGQAWTWRSQLAALGRWPE